MTVSAPLGRTLLRYKIHWHAILIHFPISFFTVSGGFMILHLFTETACFELAGYLNLVAGTVMTLPATLSGWLTWKGRYRGARGKLFIYKARIAYSMAALSILLVIWRSAFPNMVHTVWHFIYAAGVILLLIGAVAEGYYRGRLNHR